MAVQYRTYLPSVIFLQRISHVRYHTVIVRIGMHEIFKLQLLRAKFNIQGQSSCKNLLFRNKYWNWWIAGKT